MAACDQCGSTARTQGILGLEVCSACGAVRSFSQCQLRGTHEQAALRDGEAINVPQSSLCPQQLRVQATTRERVAVRAIVVDDAARRHRIQRCKEAIALLSSAVRIQDSVREPALALLLKHCQRVSRVPTKGRRLKKLVCACVLAASSRQGMGLTIHEVAAQAELTRGEVQKTVWKLCKFNGVRLVRNQANVDALLQRICDHLQLPQQRGAICACASRLVVIANDGWICTGRTWAFVVCAALVLALRSYHFSVTSEQVGQAICVPAGTVERRVVEMKRLLLSLCQSLPWGHLVDLSNVHVYLLFVVDFFDVLRPVAEQLRQQELDRVHGAVVPMAADDPCQCCDRTARPEPPS